jgi:hypothetical protein
MTGVRVKGDERRGTQLPFYWKLIYAALAACVVLAPLTLSLWFGLCPEYGNPRCPEGGSATFAAFRAVSPSLMQVFLVVSVLVSLLFPVSYLGLGLLAVRRSPWLATLGAAAGFVGALPWTYVLAQVVLIYTIAQVGYSPAFAELMQRLSSQWPILFYFILWVVGHLLGYLLLGIALGRARVVPLWAATLIVAGVPFQMAAYPAHLGALQIIGFVLVFIGSLPAARALLTAQANAKQSERKGNVWTM